MGYPLLSKAYKKAFPFRLGTTSYIYPAPILPNVERLGPFLDEIELVLYESRGDDNLPAQTEIDRLKELSIEMGVTFNVHLPIDIFLGDPSRAVRSEGIEVVKKFIERTRPLFPSTYTLHFSLRNRQDQDAPDPDRWRADLAKSSEEILRLGIEPSSVSIETLGYPYEWIEDIVGAARFSICLDIGHILISKRDLNDAFDRYLDRTSIIHLHGFQDGVDHLGIDRMSENVLGQIFSRLRDYKGVLSLEVFSFEDLSRSLPLLEERWKRG